MNGDGLDDLVIQSRMPTIGSQSTPKMFVYYQKPGGLGIDNKTDLEMDLNSEADHVIGSMVDMDGDGRADLVGFATYLNRENGSQSLRSEIEIYYQTGENTFPKTPD